MKRPARQRRLVLSLVGFSQLGVNLYLPSMLAMASEFGDNAYLIRLTLTLYLVGFAFATLIWGPLSDGVGRKPVVLVGVLLFAVSSGVIWVSHSIEVMLWMRLLQGIGAAGASSLSRAILTDSFSGHELTVASSHRAIASVSFGIAASILGGYIQIYFDWRMNFLFLTCFSVVAGLALLFGLEETQCRTKRQALHPVLVFRNYRGLLSSVDFLPLAVALGLAYGFGAIYQSVGPFLLLKTIGLSPVTYGWTAAGMSAGYFLGSICCARYSHRFGEHRWINRALELALLCALTLGVTGLFGCVTLLAIVIPVGLMLFAMGLFYPLVSASALRAEPVLAGTASALISFFCFGGGGVTSWAGAHLSYASQIPMALVILLELGAMALVLRLWLPWWRRRRG